MHDGGQFELYQHSLNISPNLSVIRLNLFSCLWTYLVIPHEEGKVLMIIITLSACQHAIIKSADTVYGFIDSTTLIGGDTVTCFMMF